MNQPWPELAEFEHPPVTETVLSVKFQPLPGLDPVRIIEFWIERLRDNSDPAYPNWQLQPPYDMPLERFDIGPGQVPGGVLNFNLMQGPMPTRYWFSSSDNENLVQLQSDWIAFNWRKQANSDYRRYEHGIAQFNRVWTDLSDFCATRGIGKINPIQCEVTYINHIRPIESVWTTHQDSADVLTLLQNSRGHLPPQDGVGLTCQYVATDSDNQPFARLHVQFNSAFLVDDKEPIFAMTLTFRGRPPSNDIDGVRAFFDSGHNWIVGSFDELTTDAVHRAWIRRPRSAERS